MGRLGGFAASQSSLEHAEQHFSDLAAEVHTKVMDLNVPMAACASMWMKLMQSRQHLLTQYGVAPEPAFASALMSNAKGKGVGKGLAVKRAATSSPSDYKQILHQAIQQRHAGASIAKEDILYTPTEDAAGGYVCSLVSTKFLSGTYSSASSCQNKKEAEKSAAMVAVQHEFPELYRGKLPAASSSEGGKKRKAEGAEPSLQHLMQPNLQKGEVNALMQVILERSCTRADVVYNTEQLSPSSYSSTMTFPSYDLSVSFSGTGATRKEAENACAVQALEWLRPIVEPLMEQHKAKVAVKAAEQEERRKLKRLEAEAAGIGTAP